MKIALGLCSTLLTPSFSSSRPPASLTHGPGVMPSAVSQNDKVPDPGWGKNALIGAFLPPTWDQLVSAQVKIATSCAGVSVLGAAVTVWVAQLTASMASAENATPPLLNGGSLAPRAREDRAKFVQNGPLVLALNVASWAIPAEDPFGRTIFGQSAFSAIMSPILLVIGLTASQLYSWGAAADTVVL